MPKNYGKQQEFFAKEILISIFKELIQEGFGFSTCIGKYSLVGIDSIGTPEGGEQLTDKIITLKFNINGIGIFDSYIFIESKAYLKGISQNSVTGSFEAFENKLPQFGKIGHGSIYLIFRGLEERSDYYLIKKRIEDDPNLPDHYFELDKNDFKDNNGKNNLEELFLKFTKNPIDNQKHLDLYIMNNPSIIYDLKQKLKIELNQACTKYDTSEKRLISILKMTSSLLKSKISKKNDFKRGFLFEESLTPQELIDISRDHEGYLINKQHYFSNPLINSFIRTIEINLQNNIFPELDQKEYNKLSLCTEDFLLQFNDLTTPDESEKKVKDYLFEGGKQQKRGFLYDQGSYEKCLFHCKKDRIIFISKLTNHD